MKKKTLGLVFILFLLLLVFGCSSPINETTKSKNDISVKSSKESIAKESVTSSEVLQKLKIDYPELYKELLKLPELKDNTDRNKDAIEQIACLGLSNENKRAFELILNEGLKAKRKYCTPLEALLWIAYDDKDFNKHNPLIGDTFTVTSLIQDAWTTTSTSEYFSSKRWSNFDEVTDRLNSPQLIALYMQKNISYSYTPYEKEGVKSAKEIFKNKKGACYDQALFASYLLRKNGYDKAWGTAIRFDKLVDDFYGGHVANIYVDSKDNHYYSMDFGHVGYTVYGPFATLEEAAKHICYAGSQGKANLKSYKCYDISLTEGKYIKTADYFEK